MNKPEEPTLYGIIAEFDDPDDLIAAAGRAHADGYRNMDAYTPFPVHGLAEAIDFKDDRLPWMIFLAGVAGAFGGYLLQYFVSVVDYPLNVGGRPLNSWPLFIPVTFECTILLAATTGVFGMLFLNGFPRPHHPIFNAQNFERASQDGFFLCIEADDPQFDLRRTRQFLERLGARSVSEVER